MIFPFHLAVKQNNCGSFLCFDSPLQAFRKPSSGASDCQRKLIQAALINVVRCSRNRSLTTTRNSPYSFIADHFSRH